MPLVPHLSNGHRAPHVKGGLLLLLLLLLLLPWADAVALSRRTFTSAGVALTGLPGTASAAVAASTAAALAAPLADGSTRLILCRHGETEYNRLGMAQGRRVDADLNDFGRMQAAALGAAVARSGVDVSAVYCSSLQRARHTAEAVATAVAPSSSWRGNDSAHPRLPVQPTGFLDEIDYGQAEGTAAGNAAVAQTLGRWGRGDAAARVGSDGESAVDVAGRVRGALRLFGCVREEESDGGVQVVQSPPSSNANANANANANGGGGRVVVAASHSTFIRFFLHEAAGLPLAIALLLDQRNCCINVLDFGPASGASGASGGGIAAGPPLASLRVFNGVEHLAEADLLPRRSTSKSAAARLPAEAARRYATLTTSWR